MSRHLWWIFLPVLLAPNVATAQTPGALVEGQRVRVAYRCSRAHDQPVECGKNRPPRVTTGQFMALDGDTLRLRSQKTGAELAIPAAHVDRLWVVDGRKSHFWAGVGIGFLGGAVVGAVIGSTQEFCILSCGSAAGIGVVVGAPAGALLGGIVGALIRSDRWRRVRVNDLHLSVEPQREGVGLSVSVAF